MSANKFLSSSTKEKCVFFGNDLLQTLAKMCMDNINAMCNTYYLMIKNVTDLPACRLKDIIWFSFCSLLS